MFMLLACVEAFNTWRGFHYSWTKRFSLLERFFLLGRREVFITCLVLGEVSSLLLGEVFVTQRGFYYILFHCAERFTWVHFHYSYSKFSLLGVVHYSQVFITRTLRSFRCRGFRTTHTHRGFHYFVFVFRPTGVQRYAFNVVLGLVLNFFSRIDVPLESKTIFTQITFLLSRMNPLFSLK